MACPSPLKPEQCDVLTAILQYIRDTGELIQKCKDCGLDVDQHEQRNKEQEALASSIKRVFYPLET